ncbi:hypothetical protein [Candidatus Regiella endosymbiont of Tuberolachnus salignus]|uniref:hypothetical protein n=1 Tax=Candidatus Regiella endosymbiont of Tuberolachnus salignus TaxID=3077956 RepID=UPI0030CEAC03
MKRHFTSGAFPELILSGKTLAQHGFKSKTRIKLLIQDKALWITHIGNNETWNALCEANEPELGADWVRDKGEMVISGSWLTDIGITQAEHVEITAAAPGVIKVECKGVTLLA